jgi:hypothetical protein
MPSRAATTLGCIRTGAISSSILLAVGVAAATSSGAAVGTPRGFRGGIPVANFDEAQRLREAIMAEKSRAEAERRRRRSSNAW